MTVSHQTGQRLRSGIIWLAFAAALALATAPAWRLHVFGFNPTLDEVLQLSICGGALNK
jgi:hypothetical protein